MENIDYEHILFEDLLPTDIIIGTDLAAGTYIIEKRSKEE